MSWFCDILNSCTTSEIKTFNKNKKKHNDSQVKIRSTKIVQIIEYERIHISKL
jgi:hypothetical protein